MSFRRFVTLLVFLAVFTMAVRVSVASDTWWHLRAGRLIVENRHILDTDPFSLTRQGEAWIYPGWLAQIILFGVYHFFSYAGLNLLIAVMVALAFGFIWSLLEAPPLMRAFVIILAAAVSGVYWSARPHIFSFTLSAIFLWTLIRAQDRGEKWLLLLPPLMALWSNLHGGFAFGFILILAFLLGELIIVLERSLIKRQAFSSVWGDHRRNILSYTGVGLLCAVAVTINPHGPVMLLYPFRTISIGVLRDYIQEWQSPNFHRMEVQPFIWLLFLVILALSFSDKRKSPAEMILLLGFTYLSLTAARNFAIFALVAAPLLAKHGYRAIERFIPSVEERKRIPLRIAKTVNVLLFILLGVIALIKVLIPLNESTNQDVVDTQLPTDAVEYLAEYVSPGPIFNSYNWGGYLIWALYPKYLTFVDGRTDLFNDEILESYLSTWRADPGWEGVFKEWGIELALLEPTAPLSFALRGSGWSVLYEDDRSIIFGQDRLP